MAELVQIDAQSHAQMWTWNNLTEADTNPVFISAAFRSDASVMAFGTFSGGTVTWQGTMQTAEEVRAGGATWVTLTDIDGNALAHTAPTILLRRENVLLMRPLVTAGAGVDVTARVLLCGNR